MNYLIAGLAKSGTTMLFSRICQALDADVKTFFEPEQPAQLTDILFQGLHGDTLTKVLVGRVMPDDKLLDKFDKHIVIYRDPRDQFVSMLLYIFYDFQVSGDQEGYDKCFAALEAKQQDPAGVSALELYNALAGTVGRAPVEVFNNLHQVQKNYMEAFAAYRARYEDLVDGQWGVLEEYLGLSLSLDAQVPRKYNRVVRSKGYGDWRNWLNAADIEYTNAHWGESIVSLGYSRGEIISNQVIAVETTLDYVRQFDPRQNQSSQ